MDSILYWNDVALEANRVSHTDLLDKGTLGPTLSSRALAITHLAMYDAYAGVVNDPANLPPYLSGLPAPAAGASAAAAASSAAHATLAALYPSQKAFFELKHLQAGLTGPGVDSGHDFGLLVARQHLALRKNDPGASDDGYAPSQAPGRHRPDPDNPQGYHAPFYGADSNCFAVTARHGLLDPPQPGTPDYQRALRQVRGKGIAPELMGTLPTSVAGLSPRTVDEYLIGVYWGYDGAAELGTPPRLYNQIVRRLADAKGNTEKQNAKLFALVNVAMGDAGILAWEQKYKSEFWRPVVGIREHDKSMGPAGAANNNINNDCDPNWLPLGAPLTNKAGKNFTPPFPAYPSGHATFGAAAFQAARRFYGVTVDGPDTLFAGLDFISDEFNGINKDNKSAVRPRHVRDFPGGLWQMIIENGFSRVFIGVHWSFDAFALDSAGNPNLAVNIGGVPLGLKIANDITNKVAGVSGTAAGWKSTV